MRVLIATAHRNVIGGVETYLHTLIPDLLSRGHQIAMLYDYVPTVKGTPVDPSGAGLPLWFSEELRQDPSAWAPLHAWKPDVIYSHGLESLDVESHLLESYPTIAYRHDYRGTCATGLKCHAFPRVRPCTRTFGPMCLVLHYPRRCGGINPSRALKMFQVEKSRNAQLSRFQAVLVASTHMYHEFRRHGMSADRLHLVPLPIPDVEHTPAPDWKTPQGRILFIGRLTELKGANYLIRAIPSARQKLGRTLNLTIVGDGSERKNLQDLAAGLGVTVEFAGWADAAQKDQLIRAADLVAVPSLWPEPFGLVGIEAGCRGVPAVGYAVGGIPDWLIGGQTGEIAPGDPPTVDGLSDAIVRALQYPDHYTQLCRGAWELSKRFSMQAHLTKLEGILAGIAQAARPTGLLVP